MKTNNLFTFLVLLSFIVFISVASIANGTTNYKGGKSTESLTNNVSKVITETSGSVAATSNDIDFSYLRFDLNKFTGNSNITEVPPSLLNDLRFDVNDYINSNSPDMLELPVMMEFEYLRFEANKFDVNESEEIIELPVNEFDYLRFNVNDYMNTNNNAIDELR